MSKEAELKIVFPNEKIKRIFATWLCDGGGEQDFASACESEDHPIHLGLSYHGPEDERYAVDDARRYGKFLCDNTIRVRVPTKEESEER
jgi:hypothetical protein